MAASRNSLKPGFVWLASQSPRRAQLLDQLGVPHRVLAPLPGEDTESIEAVHPGEAPARYVQRVTRLKLAAAQARLARLARLRERDGDAAWPQALVLCSDTTVALGRDILGKPADAAEARAMLRRLSGQTHRVLTAVAVQGIPARGQAAGQVVSCLSRSSVRFDALREPWLRAYVASGEPMGKAGAYAVQGRAAEVIVALSGSYSGIMGLPLHETAQALRTLGLQW